MIGKSNGSPSITNFVRSLLPIRLQMGCLHNNAHHIDAPKGEPEKTLTAGSMVIIRKFDLPVVAEEEFDGDDGTPPKVDGDADLKIVPNPCFYDSL
mmetsp:Transcript_36023/g.101424  ORF Transcript_36023/g.101424 Transcript_36023/m.101424 type:complete len:96 (-) Transcript_36023:53-340(-)